ncbi:hypothetical protein NA56DRAFT_697028 [Hyaloscypha hepaticicola]|uniref:RING-type domain-containing protein n=1 Tax=Hyaloscypha hepaticicola TaxID=2082293 RepID=A0A2J6QP21_9HELO|nr:hypothetical protein NA56DRAFT_697028 [Hyaloscypha hepaticicola]
MCRQYRFRFLECGHVYGNLLWGFRLAHHPPGCVMEEIIFERSQHCFDCLLKEKIHATRRNFPQRVRLVDLSLAADRLNRILTYLRQHPDGPQHIDEDNLAALCCEHQKLSEADRLYVEQYEEDCDQWLWAVKDAAEDFEDLHSWCSVEALIQGFYYQRIFVLKLRFAHLTALVQDREKTYTDIEKIVHAMEDFRTRVKERIYTILTEVEDKDLTKDDSCPICYRQLVLSQANDSDGLVKTPCGHIFCKDCIIKEDAANWETIRHEVFGPIRHPPEVPTPWWVTMLKNE